MLSPVYSQMLRAVVAPPYPQAVCLAATVAGWATQCCVLAPARHGFCGVTKPRARALHAQGGDVSSLFSSYRVSSGGQLLSASFCLYFPVGLLFGSCEGRDFLLALPEVRNHLRCICCSREVSLSLVTVNPSRLSVSFLRSIVVSPCHSAASFFHCEPFTLAARRFLFGVSHNVAVSEPTLLSLL